MLYLQQVQKTVMSLSANNNLYNVVWDHVPMFPWKIKTFFQTQIRMQIRVKASLVSHVDMWKLAHPETKVRAALPSSESISRSVVRFCSLADSRFLFTKTTEMVLSYRVQVADRHETRSVQDTLRLMAEICWWILSVCKSVCVAQFRGSAV